MSFYKKLFDIINEELDIRESTLPAQRQSIETEKEAAEITKNVAGYVLAEIESKWNGNSC